MPLASTAAESAAVSAVVASFPVGTLHLYAGVPDEGGVELPEVGGYAPLAHNPASWSEVDGVASLSVDFGTSTAAWGGVATHWAIRDSVYDEVWFWELLPSPVSVTAAGTSVSAVLQVFFRDEV